MSEQGAVIEGPGLEVMKPLRSDLGYHKRMGGGSTEIPLPPPRMRRLAGHTDPAAFDNPSGRPVFPHCPVSAYEAVFDLGCGCGRIARQLLQQQPRPTRYVGIDVHRPMIEWCQANLTPIDGNFVFHHHDIFEASHAPDNTKPLMAPFEIEDSAFSLVIASSVFTHLHQQQAMHYLNEIARIMRPNGRFVSEWFLFDRREFPMMKLSQNTLFIDENDPTNAVIYDRDWLREAVDASELAIADVEPPSIRGSYWSITMVHKKPGIRSVDFPPDTAPYGSASEAPVGRRKLSDKEVRGAISQVEHWYHRIEVAPGIVTPGVHDSEAALEAMMVPKRLDGQRVLDVGARDGYFSFAAEARGAEVLAIDSIAPDLTGFSIAADFMESSVEYRTMNVYDVRPEEVGTFDAIFFLGVLYHLRDPMLALDRLWSVTKPGATIWVESHVIDQKLVDPETGEFRDLASVAPKLVDVPIAQFYPKDLLSGDTSNWWGPNLAGLEAIVGSAGFEVVRSRLVGSRGLVVARKIEDTETDFFREFDRSDMTGEEGMTWDRLKQGSTPPQYDESLASHEEGSTTPADEAREAISEVEHWYHRIEVAPGVVTPGIHDSEAALEAMEVPERLDGQRVLDVGARDGYFSFVAEARGAEVLAIDSVAPEHLTGFATASSLLSSSVEYRTMNVYDVRSEEVGTFDAIFFLGVLYHLRDPMLALDRLWEVAKPGATIWVESHTIDHGFWDSAIQGFKSLSEVAPGLVNVPIAQFYPADVMGGNFTNWWGPNLAGLEAMVESAGFEIVRSRLIGSRGLVVGRKKDDAETSFFRNFDRGVVIDEMPRKPNGDHSAQDVIH